jgi:Helicase conserved C-terminal domain
MKVTSAQKVSAKVALFPPQETHVDRLVKSIFQNGFASDYSGTGTGKTYCGAAIIKAVNAKRVIVICPKIVMPSWRNVLAMFGVQNVTVINYEKIARGNTPHGSYRKCIDPRTQTEEEMFHFDLVNNDDAFVVLDESHKCKGYKSLNSELLISCKRDGIKYLTLSATQALSPLDMFVYGWCIGEHSFKDFHAWAITCGAHWTTQGYHMTIDTSSPVARQKMAELHHTLMNRGIVSRMKAEDFGNLFPDNHINAEVFDMGANGDKMKRVYDQMEYELAMLSERQYSDHIFAIITRARRNAELLKVPTFVELAIAQVREGKSVCIFVNFTETLESIYKKLAAEFGENQIAVVKGGQKDKARELEIQAFQDNLKKIIICNMAAGGVGVSFHDLSGKHPRVSLISPNYSGIQFVQALGRIHRAGGLSTCYQFIVFCAGTIEEEICIKIKAKLENLDALNDGDLSIHNKYGLAYAQEMEEAC